MKKYLDLSGNSGVYAYELGQDFIRIQFVDGTIYLYTVKSTGAKNIQHMQSLAQNGRGLSTFISQKIKNHYAKKEQ